MQANKANGLSSAQMGERVEDSHMRKTAGVPSLYAGRADNLNES